MIRNLFLVIAASILLLVVTQVGRQTWIRSFIESRIANPTRLLLVKVLMGNVTQKGTKDLIAQKYNEQLRQLTRENMLLRTQLGSVPEEGKLFPVHVVWTTISELIVQFPYENVQIPRESFVVFENIFIGTVERTDGRTLVVYKANHSRFSVDARSERGVQGRLSGSFNEEVRFETNVDAALEKNDRVYAIDKHSGGVFLVGVVKQIILNERLPVKTAIIEYYGDSAWLETAFVLL
ncbi:MAG: hypothetical protein WC775_05585 [Patescibacteria group bacterium]|jgi:hypothetical protein